MTVIVTGGAGFLGSELVAELLRQGRHVTVLAHGNAASSRRRIVAHLDAAGLGSLFPTGLDALLRVVSSDVTHSYLGLDKRTYQRLAAEAKEVWHVAASVVLDGRCDLVWRTNALGTAHVLRFVSLTGRDVPLRHISTAFVAGRQGGLVREAEGGSVREFENWYERSKRAAELLVERFAATRTRRTLILRPSILVPVRPSSDLSTSRHTLGIVRDILCTLASREAIDDGRLVLRIGADPRAHLNLLPVDWAAQTMLEIAGSVDRRRGCGAEAVHIVHPTDVPVQVIASALENVCPVRLRLMPAAPSEPTRAEAALYRLAAGFLPYLYHRRRFDSSVLLAAIPDRSDPPTVDRDFLSAGLASATADRSVAARVAS